jgi:hypothetical protein
MWARRFAGQQQRMYQLPTFPAIRNAIDNFHFVAVLARPDCRSMLCFFKWSHDLSPS